MSENSLSSSPTLSQDISIELEEKNQTTTNLQKLTSSDIENMSEQEINIFMQEQNINFKTNESLWKLCLRACILKAYTRVTGKIPLDGYSLNYWFNITVPFHQSYGQPQTIWFLTEYHPYSLILTDKAFLDNSEIQSVHKKIIYCEIFGDPDTANLELSGLMVYNDLMEHVVTFVNRIFLEKNDSDI
jgi:hypothetical protein